MCQSYGLSTVDNEQKHQCKPITAAQLLATLLISLKDDAQQKLGPGYAVGNVVLTVPAAFGPLAVLGVLEASQLAGLEVSRVITKPMAASLAHFHLSEQTL